MQITSSDFADQEPIPAKFSRDDQNINPSLTFSEIPEDAQSLALIVEDPDSPSGVFTHWILYNMSPTTLQIVEGELPISGMQGRNDFGEDDYGGPQPHSGTHKYEFKLLALDTMLEFDYGSEVNADAFRRAVEGHVIDQVKLTGTFSAPDTAVAN